MPPHLLNLPTELLVCILSLICNENARSIQACRQTCRTLNTIIAQPKLLLYLERVALLGMYDPLLLTEGGAVSVSSSATLALPDRVATLQALEEAWNALAGRHDGEAPGPAAGVFWQERGPDLRIALPPSPWFPPSIARTRNILAPIVDPEASVGWEDGKDGVIDASAAFSFGPWFLVATFDTTRSSYWYLDLHGCLDGVEGEGAPGEIQSGGKGKENDDEGADYDRVYWTCIKVPVLHVLEIVLSTELDLAIVISVQLEHYGQEGDEVTSTHLAVRPLRFRDGTPHPYAKVPTIRFVETGAALFSITQVLGDSDYLLFRFGAIREGEEVNRLYLIAWKQGPITLVSIL